MSVRTRILLVDDHFVVRSGLAASLGLESDFEVTAEADSVLGALEICSREQFDVVLLDLQLPDGSGLDAIEPILNCQKEAAVLLFSTFVRVDEIDRAMTAGASGFVAKSVDRDDLIRAIRAAVAGREVLSDDLTDQLRVLRSGPAITERERDILALVTK
ncbi:MAG: response regulator transcription factor [Verrucomicrobiota bacterium]